ncbi:helix-turn-helix transcriptional regulator [bacterium]|nr:helix-turn-helix transcriptional regulator [bacterium]
MQDTTPTRGSTRVAARTKASLPALAALTAFFLSSLYIRMLNATIFPAVAALAPLAREASTGCGIATSLLVALVMLRRPSAIRERLFAWLAPALAGGGHLVSWAGVALDSGAIATAGLCLSSVGYAWLSLLVLVAMCNLDFRRLAVGLPLASGLAYLCAPVLEAIPLAGGVACLTYALATVPLISRSVRQPLELAASSPALDGATLLHPSSYLPLTSTLYVCMLLFSIASGFGTRFFSDAGSLWGQVAAGGTLLALAAWNVRARGSDRLDALFSLVLIVTMTGFFLALLPTASVAASLLLGVGSSVAGVLFDLVLVVVAARNPRAELLVFAWGGVMSTLGAIIGANVGGAVGDAGAGSAMQFATVIVAIALLAYVELGMRSFSFSATIRGLRPDEGPAAQANPSHGHTIEQACEDVARSHDLTPRELDVLVLLARGRNAAYIEEELTLAHNTVKSYIKHVYAKLVVHSQQELIDLVERTSA